MWVDTHCSDFWCFIHSMRGLPDLKDLVVSYGYRKNEYILNFSYEDFEQMFKTFINYLKGL